MRLVRLKARIQDAQNSHFPADIAFPLRIFRFGDEPIAHLLSAERVYCGPMRRYGMRASSAGDCAKRGGIDLCDRVARARAARPHPPISL